MKRILVVDDEPTIRELIADALRESGYAVHTAVNGIDALECLRRQIADAIVLDLMMPVLDGDGFVRLLRRDPRLAAIPIVLVTAAYGPHIAAERVGAQACLTKPFELDELIDVIGRVVGDPIAA